MFSALLKQLYLDRKKVAFIAAADYAVGAHDLFTIQGGPVIITGFFCRFTGAEASTATMAVTVAGIAAQNAAVNVDGAINTVAIFPLNAAAGSVVIPGVLATPIPTLGAVGNDAGFGLLSSVGDIVLTVAVADTDGLPEFFCVYQPVHPAANIVLA